MRTFSGSRTQDPIEFRSAVDLTVELFCRLCGRIVFELHADSAEDGVALARDHLRRVHPNLAEDRHG